MMVKQAPVNDPFERFALKQIQDCVTTFTALLNKLPVVLIQKHDRQVAPV